MKLTEKQINTAKMVVRFVVRYSTKAVVITIIRNSLPEPENKAQTIKFYIGGIAVANVVGDKAGDWIDREIDEIIEAIKKWQEKRNTIEETTEEIVES